ncbi:MAG: hypothetical protein LPK07_09995, partial [Hymenobacteraceae bacterium]|nr:hypothetical protein [Hymenobacteraceae bacterium]
MKFLFFIISVGVVSRFVLFQMAGDPASQIVTYEILTPTCIDGFGFGALLAYWHLYGKERNPILAKAFFVAAPLWLLLLYFNQLGLASALGRVVVALLAMLVIERANIGFGNWFGRFLENKVVLYLAKISYGIYLYHIFAVFFLWEAMRRAKYLVFDPLGLNIFPLYDIVKLPVVSLVLYVLLTVAFASASWYFLEKPINSLKRFFGYTKPRTVPKAAPTAADEPEVEIESVTPPAAPISQPQLAKKI